MDYINCLLLFTFCLLLNVRIYIAPSLLTFMHIEKGLLRNKLKKDGYIFSSNLHTNFLPGYIAWHLFVLSTHTIQVGMLTALWVYTDVIGTLCR